MKPSKNLYTFNQLAQKKVSNDSNNWGSIYLVTESALLTELNFTDHLNPLMSKLAEFLYKDKLNKVIVCIIVFENISFSKRIQYQKLRYLVNLTH